eukprot:scaffold52045_cov63-Phaeocystis_antarctica.AAC.2
MRPVGGEYERRAQAAQMRPCHPDGPLEKRRRRQVSSAFCCLPPKYMPRTSTPKWLAISAAKIARGRPSQPMVPRLESCGCRSGGRS